MEEKKKAIVIQQFDDTLEVLQELNFKVMEADDCIDGIRKTIRYNPDLVITEINTPNLTGLSMANILGMLKIDTPIVLTAQTNKYAKAAAAFSNVIGCIPDKQIPFKLKPTLIGGLKNYKIDEDLVYPYALRQHEWADMMGLQGRKRILLVEDEEYVRKAALVKIDKADEYALFTAEDGLDGILKALLINPDLILADIKMPVLDGLAMSQLFFILNKPFPIVFLTASESESTRKKAQKIDSVIGYMTKKEMRAGKRFYKRLPNSFSERKL